MGIPVEPRAVWSALRRGWWICAAGLLIGGGIAFGVSLLIGPRYSTQMQFFVSTTGSTSTSDAFQGGQLAQQRVASYTGLLTGKDLATRVVDRLDVPLTPAELAGEISATTVTGTVLIDVTVTDPSPVRAEQIANALGTEFPRLVSSLESASDPAAPTVNVALTDAPGPAVQPSPPLSVRTTVLGAVLGLLVGAGLAVARTMLDRSLTEQEDAVRLGGAPVIGVVFRDDSLGRRRPDERQSGRAAEQYRQLRSNLQFLNVDAPPRVVMVSSAVPSEGKTTTVVNLAIALADAGHRVTVVDADLRRPKVTETLDLVPGVGLTNVLAGTAAVEEVVQRFGDRDLFVIGAGPTPPNPGELLGSGQMRLLLEKLRSENDYVLVDAAPLLPVADSWGLAAHTDGVLLVVRHGRTRKEQFAEAAAAVRRVGSTALGTVMTVVPLRGELAAAHAQGYDYGYDG
jgi:capsular exopolysaccharide synthesis family protein